MTVLKMIGLALFVYVVTIIIYYYHLINIRKQVRKELKPYFEDITTMLYRIDGVKPE